MAYTIKGWDRDRNVGLFDDRSWHPETSRSSERSSRSPLA
jgi:hypothetical protein